MEQVVSENAKVAQDQQSYQERYNTLAASYQVTEEAYLNKMNQLQERRHQQKQLKAFVEVTEQQDKLLTTFDETLFCTLVDQVVIHHNKQVDIHFKNGQDISQ